MTTQNEEQKEQTENEEIIENEAFCDGESTSDDIVDNIVNEEQEGEDWFSQLEALKEETATAKDKLIRSHAEIENIRKRHNY